MKRALRKLRPFDVVESFELNGEKFEVEWAQREVDCVLHEHGKLKKVRKNRNAVDKYRNRVAKFHGYDGYIRVKKLAGKSLAENAILQNKAFF